MYEYAEISKKSPKEINPQSKIEMLLQVDVKYRAVCLAIKNLCNIENAHVNIYAFKDVISLFVTHKEVNATEVRNTTVNRLALNPTQKS